MAFPTGSAAVALNQIDSQLLALRRQLTDAISRTSAGVVTSEFVLNLHVELRSTVATLNELKLAPGMAKYAQQVKGDDGLDVAIEFNAVIAKIADAVDWIEANFPKASIPLSGGWLFHVRFENGAIVFNQFSKSATANLRTALQAIVDLIGV